MPTTNVKGPQPNIAIIGGGPGGLYSGLLLKKADPRLNITIFERNPRRATYGWGVVFSDRTLSAFREADVPTYRAITGRFVLWDAIDVRYRGRVIRCGGHVFAGLARRELLKILQNRCRALGVSLQFETEVAGLETVAGADLIIAADGVNSMVRRTFADVFKPDLDVGRARYIWYGTSQLFDAFTFIFRENEHGLFQVHAYPFDGQTSTFIIECSQSTWRRAGLDAATEADSIAYCQNLFAPDLGSHRLMSNKSRWINFVRVKNRVWHHNNIVLLGDAVHTAHFSIGSGTKLAMEDAIALATAVEQNPGDLETALTHYEMERRPRVEALQAAALESRTYFENVERYLHLEPEQFTFHLLTRSGRLSRNTLMQRDPAYVEAVDRRFAAAHAGPTHPSPPARGPPPRLNP
ncbi:MAG: FAD-dependent monooxygenase, partial [Anaerolineae bacterium]